MDFCFTFAAIVQAVSLQRFAALASFLNLEYEFVPYRPFLFAFSAFNPSLALLSRPYGALEEWHFHPPVCAWIISLNILVRLVSAKREYDVQHFFDHFLFAGLAHRARIDL